MSWLKKEELEKSSVFKKPLGWAQGRNFLIVSQDQFHSDYQYHKDMIIVYS